MSGEAYRPGTCNIGDQERRQRRRLSYVATVLGIGWVVGVWLGYLPEPLLLVVFIPAMLAVEWSIESRTAFCVRLAARGRYSFDGRTDRVADEANHDVDVARAVRITVSAALVAAAITAVLYVLLIAVG